MRKYIIVFMLSLVCSIGLESCGGFRTGWTPYRPSYKKQKRGTLEWMKMGSSPLTRRNATR